MRGCVIPAILFCLPSWKDGSMKAQQCRIPGEKTRSICESALFLQHWIPCAEYYFMCHVGPRSIPPSSWTRGFCFVYPPEPCALCLVPCLVVSLSPCLLVSSSSASRASPVPTTVLFIFYFKGTRSMRPSKQQTVRPIPQKFSVARTPLTLSSLHG